MRLAQRTAYRNLSSIEWLRALLTHLAPAAQTSKLLLESDPADKVLRHILSAAALVVFGVLYPSTVIGQIKDVHVIVENDKTRPGQARIWFPHLGRWQVTNPKGVIPLNEPYDGDEIIEVAPNDSDRYGRQFRRVFPKEDGYVTLVSLHVTVSVERNGAVLAEKRDYREAAAAYGLASARWRKSEPEPADRRIATAYTYLGYAYDIKNPYVYEKGNYKASPELLNAINNDPLVKLKPNKPEWDPTDFKNIAGLPSLSPLIEPAQKANLQR